VAYPTLLETPDYTATADAKREVSNVKFGDGYVQDIVMGINSVSETFSLKFKRRPAEATALYEWFKANGMRFYWTPPDSVEKLWTLKGDIHQSFENAGWYSVSVILEQRFDPDVP